MFARTVYWIKAGLGIKGVGTGYSAVFILKEDKSKVAGFNGKLAHFP
jgi:hypothetical protein